MSDPRTHFPSPEWKPSPDDEVVVFPQAVLVRCVPKWWQVRRRIRARRWWREVQEHMKRDDFAFMGRREDFMAWDDPPPPSR